jgi:hypothetical protein
MKRTFKEFTVVAGNTPQPLIGTKLGAATVISSVETSVLVADSSMFRAKDKAAIGTLAVGDEEITLVTSVPDATHIKVQGLAKAHLINAYVRLVGSAEALYVQTKDGNTGAIFLGTQGMVKTGFVNCIVELKPVAALSQPVDWTDPMYVGANGVQIGDYWVDGTTNDSYRPSLTVL